MNKPHSIAATEDGEHAVNKALQSRTAMEPNKNLIGTFWLIAIALVLFSPPLLGGDTDALPHPASTTLRATNSPAGPTNPPSVTPMASASTSSTLAAYVPDDKYRLRIGDKVSFQVIEDRDQPRGLVVADSGELDVPYLGRVLATDKTCKELAAEIKSLLEREYYYRASVVLALDTANRVLGRVYIWGQVKNQGPIELAINERLTAGQAVLRAGGFGDFANKKKVKVIRPGVNNAGKEVFELNMVEVLEDGHTKKDVLLQPDDSVIVRSRLINF